MLGLAVGKAALAMARGVGAVARGLIVAPADDGRSIPAGWRLVIGAHPVPDARSEAAAVAAIALLESAHAEDIVLALISGGASSLMEQPRAGHTLDEVAHATSRLAARGATIRELNVLRTELSAIKGGQLAQRSAAPVTTFVVSDVIGDDPRVIGSGPTIDPRARTEVVAPMQLFGEAIAHGLDARRIEQPVDNDVHDVAEQLAREAANGGPIVAWGEPTVRVPEEACPAGGRAQQLALELARLLQGTQLCAFVAGSDGVDGRTRAAGAFVDGATWTEIRGEGIDPDEALRRFEATRALAAVGAQLITGPTGINHADVMVIG
jgi:hydroxypyruvate reductase